MVQFLVKKKQWPLFEALLKIKEGTSKLHLVYWIELKKMMKNWWWWKKEKWNGMECRVDVARFHITAADSIPRENKLNMHPKPSLRWLAPLQIPRQRPRRKRPPPPASCSSSSRWQWRAVRESGEEPFAVTQGTAWSPHLHIRAGCHPRPLLSSYYSLWNPTGIITSFISILFYYYLKLYI